MPTFTFDDQVVPFREGQSVGAALLAVGVRSLRTTRNDGRPRGLFCGIGICFDCLVVVDDHPNERACRVAAVDGAVVRTQIGTGHGDLEV